MPTMSGSLLVAGTTSDAGKSVLTAGICRWLARRGVRVAPFKAQNMSNNSMVAPDGAEIGRAQAMQAAAAGVPAEAAMNPVLLKPGSNLSSQVVLLGRAVGETGVAGYWGSGEGRARLLAAVLDAYDDLRSRFDVVICEGAGSPAEINLRRNDIVNMGLARARKLPVIVVGDIDRGGVFAALYGTLALLDAADQSHLSGFVINKFRGHRELLDPALTQITARTGRPVLGVLPYLDGIWIDAENSVATERPYPVRPAAGTAGGRGAREILRVAVLRLPRISNFTDIDSLALEPGVAVRFVTTPAEVADADLVVVPGSRATVADLGWLRGAGLDVALRRRAADRKPILAICGGYQMLGTVIHDDIESAAGAVDGGVAAAVSSRASACCRWSPASRLTRPWAARPAMRPGRRWPATRSTTAWSRCAAASRGSPVKRTARDGTRRLPLRCRQRHAVARNPGERRVPPGLPDRDRPPRGPELHPRARHLLRGCPAGAVRHAGRRRRGAPRHRRPAAAHRARPDPRPARPPAGTVTLRR